MTARRDLEHITARGLFVAWWHAIQAAARKLGAEASTAVHNPLGRHRQTMDAELHLPGTGLAIGVQLVRDAQRPLDHARCEEPGCGGWMVSMMLLDARNANAELGWPVQFCTRCTTREQIRALAGEVA